MIQVSMHAIKHVLEVLPVEKNIFKTKGIIRGTCIKKKNFLGTVTKNINTLLMVAVSENFIQKAGKNIEEMLIKKPL